jgi:hypothetical protein
MIRTLKICFVDPDPIKTRAFLWAHLPGGVWSLLATEYYPSGFLGVRIYGSRKAPGMFLLLGIWTSTECLEAARRTPAFPVLERFQRNLTITTIDCSAVPDPASKSDDRVDQAVFVQSRTAAPTTTPRTTPPNSGELLTHGIPQTRLRRSSNQWRLFMKSTIMRFIAISLFCAVFLSGCRSTGSEFLGRWVNKANPSDTFQVVRNGDEFLIISQGGKTGAIYKDGALEVKGLLMSADLTYVKQTDTLLGPGFFGNVEYKRLK